MSGNGLKERWYLYSDDAGLAATLLRADLERASADAERAWLLKHWPSLGGFDPAFAWLSEREPQLLLQVAGRATLLRVLQHRGDANPWLAMVPPDLAQRFQVFCEDTIHTDGPVDLWLGGGLGDQLECLARLCDPALERWWPRLRLLLPDTGRAALEPFLLSAWPSWAPAWEFAAGDPRPLQQRPWFSQMGWYALLAHAGLTHQPWRLQPGQPDAQLPPRLVCCWRSKVDPNDRHWAHLRSWTFSQILALYTELVPWAAGRGIRLIDITTYRPCEQAALAQHQPTLDLAQPSITSLSDTAALVRGSRGVITVDTALVHLAAWFGWPTLLLLHQYPDERWRERRADLEQSRTLKVLQQTGYNRWDPLRWRLLEALADWPWL